MKTRIITGIFFYVLTAARAFSQDVFHFTAGYFGETFVHPGIKTGIQMEFAGNRFHKLLGEFNLGYFYQPRISNNFFADAEIAYRLTFASGIFLQANAGLGYSLAFVDGKNFDYANGTLVETANTGDSYLMPVGSLSIGYDFGFKHSSPAALIYLKPFFFGQYPMARTFVANVGIEIGASLPIGIKGN